jgi:hypothetical protein
MRADDVLKWVRANPFVPFQIRLNSGQVYKIRHPEIIKVGRSSMDIYSYAGEPVDPYESMEMVGLSLIESIKPLDARKKA